MHENQIKEILQKPSKRQIIQKAVRLQRYIRFHTETNVVISDINQPSTQFLDWVHGLLPKDKYMTFGQLFKFPLQTSTIVEDAYRELERVFYSRNSSTSYHFTDSDLASVIHTAVISDDLARRLFGTTKDVVGRSFSLDYVNYRVCGVVRSASYLTPQSYAQVYLPYSVKEDYKQPFTDKFPYCGEFSVTFLVKDKAQTDALRAEIRDLTRRINLQHEGQWKLELWKQPTSHWLSVFQSYPSDASFSPWKTAGHLIVVVLVLLLVPALNLSGLIASRMESRLPEMGVRKSFGAGRSVLLSQVMWENFFLTLAGGLLGLILAWITVYLGREWIFVLLDQWPEAVPQGVDAYVSGEMLFAPAVFVIAFLLCLLLNLLSALLPAWMSLRKPIVYSLYEKR